MISNTITLRKFFLWNSQWFCDYNYYNLLFEDIKINNYLQSIFKYLKLPTSNFIIKRYIYKLIIQSNIHITFLFNKYLRLNKLTFFIKRHKKLMINHFVFKKSVYFFFKQISYFLYFFIYKKKYMLNNNILNNLRVKYTYNVDDLDLLEQDYYFYDKLYWLTNYIKESNLLKSEFHNDIPLNIDDILYEESVNFFDTDFYSKDKLSKDEEVYSSELKFKVKDFEEVVELEDESVEDESIEDESVEDENVEGEDIEDEEFDFNLGTLRLKTLFFTKLNYYNKLYHNLYFFYNNNYNFTFNKSIIDSKKRHLFNPYQEQKRIISIIKRFKIRSFKNKKKKKKIIYFNKLYKKKSNFLSYNNNRFSSVYKKKKLLKRYLIQYRKKHYIRYINNYIYFSKNLKKSISNIITISDFLVNFFYVKSTGYFENEQDEKERKKSRKKIIKKEYKNWFFINIMTVLHKYIEIEKQSIYFIYDKMHYFKYLNKYDNNETIFYNNRFSYNTIYFLKKLKGNVFNNIVKLYDLEKNLSSNFKSYDVRNKKQYISTVSFHELLNRYNMFSFLKKNIFFKKFKNIFKSEKNYNFKISNIKKTNIYKDYLYNIKTNNKRLLIKREKKRLEEINKVIIINREYFQNNWKYYINKLKLRYYSYYIYNKYLYIEKYSNFLTILKPLYNYYIINYRMYKLFKILSKKFIKKRNKYLINQKSSYNYIKKKNLNNYNFWVKDWFNSNNKISILRTSFNSLKYLYKKKNKFKKEILKKKINNKKKYNYLKKIKKKINNMILNIKNLKNIINNSLAHRLLNKVNHVKTFKLFKRYFKKVSFLKCKNLFSKGFIKKGTINNNKSKLLLRKKYDIRKYYHSKYTLWKKKKTNKLIIQNLLSQKYFNIDKKNKRKFKKKEFVIKEKSKENDTFIHDLLKKSYNYYFIFHKYDFFIYYSHIISKTKIIQNYNYIKILNYYNNSKNYFTYTYNYYIHLLINRHFLYLIKKYKKIIKKYKKLITKFKNINIIDFINYIIKNNISHNCVLWIYLKLISLKHFYYVFFKNYNNFNYYNSKKKILHNNTVIYYKYKFSWSKKNLNKYLLLNKRYLFINKHHKKRKIKIKKNSFLFRYIHIYYIFHKNIYFNYIINTISFFLLSKTSNRLSTIKKNIHYNNKYFFDNELKINNVKDLDFTKIKKRKHDLFIENKIKFLNYKHNSNIFFHNITDIGPCSYNYPNNNLEKNTRIKYLLSNLNFDKYIWSFYNYIVKTKKKIDSIAYQKSVRLNLYLSYFNNFLISSKKSKNDIIYFINLSKKNQFFFNWFFKRYVFNYINSFFFILKYLLYIFLKSYTFFLPKNENKTLLFNVFNNVLNNNEILNCVSRNEIITRFYYHFLKKTYYINYIDSTVLLSLFQNKSLHHYYINYYILNFWYLFYYMELTIGHYSSINCYLFMTYSLKRNYYLNSAKMWCEYISYQLEKKIQIRKIFWYIKKQQIRESRDREYLVSVNDLAQQKILFAKFPLKGIRILYSGNFKKANRKKRLFYYVWFSDVRYTGRMPLKQYKFYIDYYYSLAILRRSSVGIKFWLLFDIY